MELMFVADYVVEVTDHARKQSGITLRENAKGSGRRAVIIKVKANESDRSVVRRQKARDRLLDVPQNEPGRSEFGFQLGNIHLVGALLPDVWEIPVIWNWIGQPNAGVKTVDLDLDSSAPAEF